MSDAAAGKTVRRRAVLMWAGLAVVILVPLVAAATSPLLAWRQPVYIVAGFAGIIGMALMLLQPLLAGGYLPGLPMPRGRRFHRRAGILLVLAIFIHVAGLWITSPPDMIDALTFSSPTSFSAWGVIAMWALLAAACLAAIRSRLHPRLWRRAHGALVVVAVIGSAVHAVQIEGTMETVSKVALCLFVLIATAKAVTDLRLWSSRPRPARRTGSA